MKHCSIAAPRFHIGQTVQYTDQHERLQTGEILSIEACWPGWAGIDGGTVQPFIYYTIRHPTYRNKRAFVSETGIK